MQYDFSLAGSASVVRDVKGKFFKYKSGAGLIRVGLSTGQYVDLLPGQGIWGVDFTWLTITDKSGVANAGVVLAGEFDFHDDRIAGDVSIIDNSKSKVLSGVEFIRYRSTPAGAGTYSIVQLFNPTGSGKNIAIRQMQICSDTANNIASLYSCTVDANLSPSYPTNKNIGFPAGILKAMSFTDVVGQATTLMGTLTAIGAVPTTVNVYQSIAIVDSIILRPGFGLCAIGSIINAGIFIFVDMEEF
jgi:hypothetical protein